MIVHRLVRALTDNRIETAPDHEDPALRGRTYGVPFERVWRQALALCRDRWMWTILDTDDLDGVIDVEARTPVFRFPDDVRIRITLDEDAQTRVDVCSESRIGFADLGTNARRVRRFFRHLDRRLGEPSRRPTEGRKA